MEPTWTYHLEPNELTPELDIPPGADFSDAPWRLISGYTPERYRSEDLRLTLVVRIDVGIVWVCRWDRNGKEIIICKREGGIHPRCVIRSLNEVRPQPSKPKEWETAIEKAVENAEEKWKWLREFC